MKLIELKEVNKTFQDGRKTIEALKPTNFSVEGRGICCYYRP